MRGNKKTSNLKEKKEEAFVPMSDEEFESFVDSYYSGKQSSSGSDINLVKMYYKDISQYRLLSKEEEKKIAQRAEEEWNQQEDSDWENSARATLVKSNLRYVANVVKKYKYSAGELMLLDLIQEGNIGLIEALRTFDYRTGNRFITYADPFIRNSIINAINENGRSMQLSERMLAQIKAVNKAESRLWQEMGRYPTDRELAEALVSMKPKMTEERIRSLRLLSVVPMSLDTPIDDDDNKTTIGENIPTPVSEEHESILDDNMKGILRKALEDLNPREQNILKMKFRLDEEETVLTNEEEDHKDAILTNKELSNRLGISEMRVDQIVQGAEDLLKKKLGGSFEEDGYIDFDELL